MNVGNLIDDNGYMNHVFYGDEDGALYTYSNGVPKEIPIGGGGGGTSNYNLLSNKPQINGITLQGNITDVAMKNETATKNEFNALSQTITDLDDEKQDMLVDGVNIKTLNGNSILGQGNINIEGGELTYDKYVVLVIAGQSNAVGYDESPKTKYDVSRNTNRIKQLGYKHNHNLEIVPLSYCAENFQNMDTLGAGNNGTKGMHLPLANLLVDYIPDDYGILILPCAFGGTNFSSNTWNNYDAGAMTIPDAAGQCSWGNGGNANTGNEYRCMKDRVKYALELNNENIFLGVIWLQGEHGANNPSNNNAGFDYISNDFMTYMNNNFADRLPQNTFTKNMWINVETTGYWFDADTNKNGVKQIWEHYQQWNPSSYVEIPRSYDITNNVNGNASTTQNRPSHFGNNANRTTLAPRILRNMLDNGILLISGTYDKDTTHDISQLELQIENLQEKIRRLQQAIEDLGGNVPEADNWQPIPANLTSQQGGTDSTISGTDVFVDENSILLLDQSIDKIRFTDSVGANKLWFLIVSNNGTNTQSIMFAFTAANSSKYIDDNGLNGSQDTGHSQQERENFFGNGGGESIIAERQSDGILFTRERDGATIKYPTPEKYTQQFGFKAYPGNFGGTITNVQYVVR